MNTKSLALFATGACCALLITTTSVRSQDAEAAEAAAMSAAAPGPMHEHLAPFAGEWNVTGKWRMAATDEWVPFEAKASRELVLGGRFLTESFSSNLMGMPFEGRAMLGHDNMRAEYTSVWIDNMSTGTLIATGGANEDGTVITLTGEHSDTMSGEAHKWFQIRYRKVSENENVFESDTKTTPDGEAWMSLQLTYTRP